MKKYKLKKNIIKGLDKLLISISQLHLITMINTQYINDLYNEFYFNIIFISLIVILEFVKNNYNKIFN